VVEGNWVAEHDFRKLLHHSEIQIHTFHNSFLVNNLRLLLTWLAGLTRDKLHHRPEWGENHVSPRPIPLR
jgi:hypothetical protein